jgi:Bacterial membrane protein YfhO
MKAETKIEPGQDATTRLQSRLPSRGLLISQRWQHHAVNLALLGALLLAMFWRVFLLGETLIDVATLNNQLPWGYDAGPSDYPYNRRDLTDMYVTREYFVVAAYRDGEMPLWNPYTMAGHPIYADGVTRTLSPFLLFYKFFDVPLGYSLARIAELMLAAIFMYAFLVAIGVSPRGALIGALVFELSAHALLHITGLGWFGGLMWLPLIMLFVDRAVRRRQFTQAMIAGVMFAAQFFCGYLPNQIYYAGAIVLYYLIAAHLFSGKLAGRQRAQALGKTIALMATTLAVGFTLAATQWAPMLELLRHSNRKIVGAEMGYIYLPPWYGLTLIFPNLFGAAYDTRTLTLFTALGVSHDHILYIGIAALALLVFALFWWKKTRGGDTATPRHRAGESGESTQDNPNITPSDVSTRRRIILFALLAAISLAVMMITPLYVPVTRYIPVLQVIRVAVRAGVIFHFAVAALAALGADLLIAADRDLLGGFARLARRFFYAALGFVLIATIAALAMKATGYAAEIEAHGWQAYLRKSAAVLSDQFLPPNQWLLVPLMLLAMVAALFWFASRGRLSRRALLVTLTGLMVADFFWLSGQFNQSFARARVYPATAITNLLRRLPPGRVLVVPADLESNRRVSSSEDKIIAPPNTLLPYQISTVAGKNQQFPKWYRDYAALIEPQPNLSHVVFNQPHSRFFDLLNVRYVMTHADTRLAGYDLLATAEGVSVYENKQALPRAFFVDRAIAVASHADALDGLRDPLFDHRREVMIEKADSEPETAAPSSVEAPPNNTASANIVEDRRNRVVIETDNPNEAWLVLSDNYYPGWRATIDGGATAIFQANGAMRAVKVPAGRHVVSFVFLPLVFRASLVVSLFGAAMLGVVLTIAAMRRRKSGRAPVEAFD